MVYATIQQDGISLKEQISLAIMNKGITPTLELLEIMYKTLKFNQALNYTYESASLAVSPEKLLDVYALRSKIYKKMGYNKEFPDPIEGINFDYFDEHSAVLYTQTNGKLTGTCRVIFDSEYKLPIDKNFSLDYLRFNDNKLAELSRLMIEDETKGLNLEFKHLTIGVYTVMMVNNHTTLMSVMKEEHFSLYEKFGGFGKEASLETYGDIQSPFIITAWEVSKISRLIKKIFLGSKDCNSVSKCGNSLDKLAS